MPDGAEIHEVLHKVDHPVMEMEYAITSGPFPVEDYVSTIKVESNGDRRCRITWASTFRSAPEVEANMVGLFEGFYNVIIESLESRLNGQN